MQAVEVVLRALADARDGAFYALWLTLLKRGYPQKAKINFRLYRVSDTAGVHIAVWVTQELPDNTEWCWSVGVTTQGDAVVVEGTVEEDPPYNDLKTRFHLTETTTDAAHAQSLILQFAEQVCQQAHP